MVWRLPLSLSHTLRRVAAWDGRVRVARPRRSGPVVLGALALLAVLVGWSAWAAVQAHASLLAARDAVEELRGEELDLDAAERRLSLAARHASRADALMSQPGPALVARVPLLGRTLAAQRDVAAAAAAIAQAADRLVPLAQEADLTGGAVDAEVLRRLPAELARAATSTREPVEALRRAPTELTPGPVQEGVADVLAAVGDVPEMLRRAAAGATAVGGLLGVDGPRTIIVAIMNNAELRGAGGYASSFTVVRTDDGEVEVEPFQDVNDVADVPAEAIRVDSPPDYRSRYGVFLADSTLWKNILMSPDAPSSASVMCNVARVSPGVPCDAVVLLDVPALAKLLTVSGPVVLADGTRVTGDELVRALLVETYADADPTDESGSQRRAQLRAAADEGLAALLSSDLGAADTLRVLVEAAQGRHLAVWSARPMEQAALAEAGLDGSVDPVESDLALTSMNQLGASKLDYYVTRTERIDAVVGEQAATVTREVTLALDAPEDLPPYVRGGRGGRVQGLLDIAVGPFAQVDSVLEDGVSVDVAVVRETGAQRVPLRVDLGDGESTTWTVTTTVPLRQDGYRLEVLPQPLAVPATLELSVEAAPGTTLVGGGVQRSGPFEEAFTVDVEVERESWWSREVGL